MGSLLALLAVWPVLLFRLSLRITLFRLLPYESGVYNALVVVGIRGGKGAIRGTRECRISCLFVLVTVQILCHMGLQSPRNWCSVRDLNSQPTAYKAVALPIVLTERCYVAVAGADLRHVRHPGLEPEAKPLPHER